MMKHRAQLLLFALLCGLLAASAGCSAEAKKVEPGTCRENVSSDCGPGSRCRGTVCEDIYHPRRDIKNY